MKKCYFAIFTIILMAQLGCGDNDIKHTRLCEPDHICSFTVYKNSAIDDSTTVRNFFYFDTIPTQQIWTEFELKKGQKNVFEYVSKSRPSIIDGSTTTIIFEVDSDINNFLFQDQELKNINAIYQTYCSECAYVSKKVDKGTIRGTKINNNKWSIEIVLHFERIYSDSILHEYEIKVSDMFIVK